MANDTEADSPFFVVNDQVITHIQPICTPVFAPFLSVVVDVKFSNALVDNGTPNVIGPVDTVRAALESVGYDIIETTDENNITNIFVCRSHPATPQLVSNFILGNVRLLAHPRAFWLQLPVKHGGALHRLGGERAQPYGGWQDVHGEHPRDNDRQCADLADRADVVPGAVRAAQSECEHDRVRGPQVRN